MCRGAALISALERVVVEQLVDQVDVREQHAAAAVALEAERVERVTLGVVVVQQLEVFLVLVADDLRGAGAAAVSGGVVGGGGGGGRRRRAAAAAAGTRVKFPRGM